MKKYFLAFTAAAISTATFVNADAQNSMAYANSADVKNLSAYGSPNTKSETKNDKSALYKINFKAVQNFKNTYTNVWDETWEEVKSGFVARFTSNGVRTQNYYDKNGRWLHSIEYYNETNLPKDVRATVKINYYDYTITSVQEINMTKNNERPIYLVRLKYNNDHKTIRVCDGEMEEIEL